MDTNDIDKERGGKQSSFYERLKKQSLFSLRVYAKGIGVHNPAALKKDELILQIMKILKRKKRFEKNDKGLPVSDLTKREEGITIDLRVTREELRILSEWVSATGVAWETDADCASTGAYRSLCDKIMALCRQSMYGAETSSDANE